MLLVLLVCLVSLIIKDRTRCPSLSDGPPKVMRRLLGSSPIVRPDFLLKPLQATAINKCFVSATGCTSFEVNTERGSRINNLIGQMWEKLCGNLSSVPSVAVHAVPTCSHPPRVVSLMKCISRGRVRISVERKSRVK